MIHYDQIKDVHLEIATLCNARCPWCPRNFWGYNYNGGYPEVAMSLQDAKTIFNKDFLKQLTSIRINGNYGDIVMNPDGASIVEFFRKCNKDLKISISTNGGARSNEFWTRLAKANAIVSFDIDGLDDTHHLYRQNTRWETVIKNAKTFISAGGKAEWKMIKFKHNQHQIDQCQQLSEQLGFWKFRTVDEGRDTAPVFDNNGNLSHTIGDYQGSTNFKELLDKKQNDDVLLEDILPGRTPCKNISCEAVKLKSIYIAANGDVSPCCYTGFYPKTYGKGQYHQAANSQLIPLIKENNALIHTLQQCIQWFNEIEQSWKIHDYHNGRLIICDDNCGTQ